MEDEAQILEGGRLGQHMLPNIPCARSRAIEDHNLCLGGADAEAKGLAEETPKESLQKLRLCQPVWIVRRRKP